MKWDFNINGHPYYNYILFYVYDLIIIVFNPKEDMDDLNIIYWLNEVFVPPDRYIYANITKVKLLDRQVVFPTNFIDYLKIEIKNVNNSLGVY